MKKLVFIILSLIISIAAFAQEKVEVTISPKEMSQGNQTAFVVFIPESEHKMVENQWKRFINDRSLFEFATKGTSHTVEKALIGISNIFSSDKKTFSKTTMKVKKIGDELVVKNVMHEQLTQNHIDVYARLTGTENGVYLSSFFQFSDSVFINENNVSQDALRSLEYYIYEFGVETYKKVVEKQIDEEKRKLRDEKGELNILEKKNKALHKNVARFETDIEEYNNNIRMIENDLDRIEEQILEQKGAIRGIDKKTVEYDSLKEAIAEREKNYKKTFKQIKVQKKKIKRNYRKIKNTNADILINEKDQEIQNEAINMQEKEINKFEIKLSNIK